MTSSDTHYQPFQVAWIKNTDRSFSVFCNKGWVHGCLKPNIAIEVDDMVEIIDTFPDPFSLNEGQFLFVKVSMRAEELRPNFRIGIPGGADINVGDEVPETDEDSPGTMYYEICRAEDGIIKQKLCSDIWCGWAEGEADSSSSISSSESESVPLESSSSESESSESESQGSDSIDSESSISESEESSDGSDNSSNDSDGSDDDSHDDSNDDDSGSL